MTLARLTDEARKKGLEKARVVRKRRSEIKEELKQGKTNLKSYSRMKNFLMNMCQA